MELYPVASVNIKAIGYDPDSQRMVVQFHSGKKYAYADVPQEVHEAFLGAKSMGIFFVREIRGKYAAEKL
jgi:hypothetical protein